MHQNIIQNRFINKEKKAIFFLLAVIAILFFPADFYAFDNPLNQYLNEKALSNYEKAIEVIEDWTVKENDPIIIEINTFRIYELVKYPELIEKAINAYKAVLKNKVIQNNRAIKARINIFLNMLFLRKGNMREAFLARESLGFISKYRICRLFNRNGDFNYSFISEAELSKDDSEKIFEKMHNDEWFDASADLTGQIDAEDILGDVAGSILYLKTSLNVPAKGKYILWLGKTGYTDIWMDGRNVYSNREKHGFSFDQYCLLLSLSSGKHVLLIKTGDSKNGLKFSLRLTDEEGAAIKGGRIVSGAQNAHGIKSSLENISFFDSLENIIKIKPMNRQTAFNTGYLYYISGINSEEEEEAKTLFSIAKKTELSSASYYYLGLLEKDKGTESYFIESVSAYNRNVESICEIAKIKLFNNLQSDAYKLIESIKEINPKSVYYNKLKGLVFASRGWHYEALKESYPPKNLIKSAGYEIEADVFLKNYKYKEALNAYRLLYEMDRYNIDYLNNLLECYIKTGKYNEALGLLTRSSEHHPNNVLLSLKHARLIENTKGPGDALPYLLYARKVSPYHKDVLLQTGLVYHKLKKKELALQYLDAALKHDLKNEWIAKYIKYLKLPGPPNPTEGGLKSKRPFSFQWEALHGTLKAESPPKGGLEDTSRWSLKAKDLTRWGLAAAEINIFKSYFYGNEPELFNNIEKFLLEFPGEPESMLYYSEIGRLGRITGYERAAKTLQRFIDSLTGIDKLEKKNQRILLVKLELEKLLYYYNLPEGKKKSAEFFSVRRWSLFGPYTKYGAADIDYFFMPEIITNHKNSDIKKKEIFIQNAKGDLDFGKYLFPETGIAYAVTTVAFSQPVKIRIYSNSSYKLFLNGKEVIRNLKSEIFRKCRIIKVQGSVKTTIMFKIYMDEKTNNLRVLVTDENDKPLKTEADTSEIVHSDINFFEEMDYPFGYFSGMLHGDLHDDKNHINLKLGNYFYELGSREAIKYFRKAVTADRYNPIKLLYLAECLLDMSSGDKDSAMYMEGMEMIKDLTPPAPLSRGEMGVSSPSPSGRGGWGVRSRLNYASLLLNSGYEKEFETEINYLKSKYAYSTEPFKLLAAYYQDRDVIKSIEIYKKILARETSEAVLTNLIYIYKQLGRYKEIQSLIELYDTDGHFRKELIEALTDSEDYDTAKKIIFQGLAEKNDPYYNIKLGEINYIQGFDPAMYLQKALSINASNNSIREFLNYLETGRIENTSFKNIESSKLENSKGHENSSPSLKDIKDFVFWYKGLLQGALNIELDRVNLRFAGITQDEQIKAVCVYISRNIKHKDSFLYSPHKAMDTFYKKKGSAEDKTILALSMFTELGIKSYIAFAGQNDFSNASGFSPEIFTNILLYIPLDVKTGLWMDFSDAQYNCGHITDSLTGRDAVVIIKNGYEIKRITGSK